MFNNIIAIVPDSITIDPLHLQHVSFISVVKACCDISAAGLASHKSQCVDVLVADQCFGKCASGTGDQRDRQAAAASECKADGQRKEPAVSRGRARCLAPTEGPGTYRRATIDC